MNNTKKSTTAPIIVNDKVIAFDVGQYITKNTPKNQIFLMTWKKDIYPSDVPF